MTALETNEFAQDVHRELWEKCDNEFKSKIEIRGHRLECNGAKRLTRYGCPGERGHDNKSVDGVHLRGPSGKIMMTESVISILRRAGLTKVNASLRQETERHVSGMLQEAHHRREYWSSLQARNNPQQYEQPRRRGKEPPTRHDEQLYLPTNNRFAGLGNF